MLLNVPKLVEHYVPVEKRARFQNWLNTWLSARDVLTTGLASTITLSSAHPLLYYTATLMSTLGASRILTAKTLQLQKQSPTEHSWIKLASQVEDEMPLWYTHAQRHRRDALIMLSELLTDAWENALLNTGALNHSIPHNMDVSIGGEPTQLRSEYIVTRFNHDFELSFEKMSQLLKVCYFQIAYDDSTHQRYPNEAFQKMIVNTLNQSPECMWLTQSRSSFIMQHTECLKHTRWPAAIELGYVMELIHRNQHGYTQYKLLETMVDTHIAVDLPALDDIETTSTMYH